MRWGETKFENNFDGLSEVLVGPFDEINRRSKILCHCPCNSLSIRRTMRAHKQYARKTRLTLNTRLPATLNTKCPLGERTLLEN
jgi:hypothetical protein